MTLDHWLRREGLTEAAFATRVGVSHVTVHRWRRGLARPDWKHIPAIVRETKGDVAAGDFLADQPTKSLVGQDGARPPPAPLAPSGAGEEAAS